MTGTLFTDLEHNVADLLRENERALTRIRQLEQELAVCQADRDRARDAGERLAGACEAAIHCIIELEPWYEHDNERPTMSKLREALAGWRGQERDQ